MVTATHWGLALGWVPPGRGIKEAVWGYTRSNEEVNVLKARVCSRGKKKTFRAKSSISVILVAEVRRKTASCREHRGGEVVKVKTLRETAPERTQP